MSDQLPQAANQRKVLTVNCIEQNQEIIKSVGALNLSPTAKYVGQVMLLLPSASASQIIALTGLTKTTVYRAMSEFKEAYDDAFVEIPNFPNFPKSPTSGNNEIPNIPTDGNCSQKTFPKVPPVGILPCAPASITTHANIELSTKVLLPSEVSKKEVVGAIFENCEEPKQRLSSPKTATTGTAGKGSRLPDEFSVPSDWVEWTRVNCPGSSAETAAVEALKFANYWQSKAGAAARKTNWRKVWQNWSMTAFSRAPLRPASTAGSGRAPWVQDKIDRSKRATQIARDMGLIQ